MYRLRENVYGLWCNVKKFTLELLFITDMGEDESCCAVSCHSQRFCKQAAGEECSAAPEECATGRNV